MTHALALKAWLGKCIPNLNVWVSERDITAGLSWWTILHEQLQLADFGILCLNASNLSSSWIMYEAGALAISSQTRAVIPYMIDVNQERLPAPLNQFQSVTADRDGTWKMTRAINEAHPTPLEEAAALAQFEHCWPELQKQLSGELACTLRDRVLIIKFNTSQLVDDDTIKHARTKLKSLLASGYNRILFDLDGVTKLSSVAFTIFNTAMREVGLKRAAVAFVNMNSEPVAILKLIYSRSARFLEFDEAVHHLSRAILPDG
jgi:anti-anti-sigma regulatory factor